LAFTSLGASTQRVVAGIGETTQDKWGLVVLALIWIKLYMKFSFPRRGVAAVVDTGGSIVNQLIWVSLVTLAVIIIYRNWNMSVALFRRTWPLMLPLIWFFVSMNWSSSPNLTFKRCVLLACMMVVAFGVAAARPSTSDFIKVTAAVLGGILFVNVLAVIAVPHLARTPGAGLFLGMYETKNTSGNIAGTIVVVWLFATLWASSVTSKAFFATGTALWLFFLIGTASKTSMALAILTPMLTYLLYYIYRLELRERLLSYILLTLFTVLVFWSIFYLDLSAEEIGLLVFDDLTFTGRTALWEHVIYSIEQKPLFGYGYGAFWYVGEGTANLLGEGTGWEAVVTSAHNGYLNILLEGGLVALILCAVPLLMTWRGCLILLNRKSADRATRWIYALVFCLILYIALRDMMEASIFRSHSPSSMIIFLFFFLSEIWRFSDDRGVVQKYQPLSLLVRSRLDQSGSRIPVGGIRY